MNPRYASSTSTPPAHLAELIRHAAGRGLLIFRIKGTNTEKVPFESEAVLHQILQKLIDEKVPLSVGGHMDGPCEEICRLIDAGTLHGTAIQLAWSAPKHWTIRELVVGTIMWEQTHDPASIANCAVDPASLKMNGTD